MMEEGMAATVALTNKLTGVGCVRKKEKRKGKTRRREAQAEESIESKEWKAQMKEFIDRGGRARR